MLLAILRELGGLKLLTAKGRKVFAKIANKTQAWD
jgi:hypothetical protein